MSDDELRAEVNKRFTLNWLIQGAAQHAGMTLHHAVRDELDAIDAGLVPLYDRFAVAGILQYWAFEKVLVRGWPERFWRRAATDSRHLFYGHPVLARHGGALLAESLRRARARRDQLGCRAWRYAFTLGAVRLVLNVTAQEARHKAALVAVAERAVAVVWGIPADRLDGELTTKVAFSHRTRPRTLAGLHMRASVIGYGGVEQRDGGLVVVGRGTNWWVLTHELVKGTAELVCLHGLSHLPDETYARVVRAADGIDYEPWMLQTGGELWRRFPAVLPAGVPVAEALMHVARLPPKPLEVLVLAVIEEPEWARELMAGVCAADF